MIDTHTFRQLITAFPDVTEAPHFEKRSFRYKKKILATMDEERNRITVQLSPEQQAQYSANWPEVIYPVASKWAAHGWTHVELDTIPEAALREILGVVYERVVKKR